MTEVERRPARGQNLPGHEVAYLQTLKGPALHQRCTLLYTQGWTLQTIGESLNPPRPRSTVHVWVTKLLPTFDPAAPTTADTPKPDAPIRKSYAPKPRRQSPGIPEPTRERIASLAPTARRFRARVAPLSSPALANAELTAICTSLHANGVTVRELANAAGVTYRAMARRLGRISVKPKSKPKKAE